MRGGGAPPGNGGRLGLEMAGAWVIAPTATCAMPTDDENESRVSTPADPHGDGTCSISCAWCARGDGGPELPGLPVALPPVREPWPWLGWRE